MRVVGANDCAGVAVIVSGLVAVTDETDEKNRAAAKT